MPKEMIIPVVDRGMRTSGIQVRWTPSAHRLDFFGWYDHMVGIEGDSMSLRAFFDHLGITEVHCKQAWKGK